MSFFAKKVIIPKGKKGKLTLFALPYGGKKLDKAGFVVHRLWLLKTKVCNHKIPLVGLKPTRPQAFFRRLEMAPGLYSGALRVVPVHLMAGLSYHTELGKQLE